MAPVRLRWAEPGAAVMLAGLGFLRSAVQSKDERPACDSRQQSHPRYQRTDCSKSWDPATRRWSSAPVSCAHLLGYYVDTAFTCYPWERVIKLHIQLDSGVPDIDAGPFVYFITRWLNFYNDMTPGKVEKKPSLRNLKVIWPRRCTWWPITTSYK